MRCGLALALVMPVTAALAACGGETEAERAAKLQAARAASVVRAEGLYEPAVFDTVIWESGDARLQRGAVVWRSSCEKCHGVVGRGDGEAARELGLEVPSFLTPDWGYIEETDSLRRRIFVGLEGGMPNWGLHGLKYRDIDAAVAYIDLLVQPEQ